MTARRSPHGVKIKLGDGNYWVFAKPKVGIAPRVNMDGSISFDRTKAVVNHTERYNELLDAYVEADADSELDCLLACALDLLRECSEVPDDLIPTLFPHWFEDEENKTMWSAIKDVVFGRAPKATPVGCDARS